MKKEIMKKLTASLVITGLLLVLFSACEKDDDDHINGGDDGTTNTVTDIDGNTYEYVVVGEQMWMTENLRVERFNNEEAIPFYSDGEEWKNASEQVAPAVTLVSHEILDDYTSEEEVKINIGLHYNWHAATDDRNICPQGWRVPSISDYEKLLKYISPEADISEDIEIPIEAMEHFDFSFTLPGGGFIDNFGTFLHIPYSSDYWTSTETPDNEEAAVNLMVTDDGSYDENDEAENLFIYRGNQLKSFGMSIRCVK